MVKKDVRPLSHQNYYDYSPEEQYQYYEEYSNYRRDEPHQYSSEEDSSFDESPGDEEEWIVEKNLRAITEHGENLTKMAEEARTRYKSEGPSLMHLLEY